MEGTDDFNWNTDPDEADLVFYYLTDFCVTDSVGEICSPLLCGCEDHVVLEGSLISKSNPLLKKPYRTIAENYFVDMGVAANGESCDSDKGVWLYGRDPDVRYKLVLPPSPKYIDFSSHVSELTSKQNKLDCCLHPYDSSAAFHMTNFSITDRILGTFQTPLLTAYGKNPLALRGTALIHDFDLASRQGFPSDLTEICVQTYVQSTYVVDFGPDPTLALPNICVQDCHGNWIVLQEPCHPDYELDFKNTWRCTVGNLTGYNWPAEGDDVWRHITNYRLTTATGAMHDLEIGELEEVFILWGDLTPPEKAPCPPIAVKIYVTTHSIDVGRHLQDPEKGVWMQDVRGDWYKLLTPAPEYQPIADGFLHKAEQFIRFHDALLYQAHAAMVCAYVPESLKYICVMSVVAVHATANPKFDLHFVQENKDFVKLHLSADFDLQFSAMLVYSIDQLNGHSNGARHIASAPSTASAVTTRQQQDSRRIHHQNNHQDAFASTSSSSKTASQNTSDSDDSDLMDTFAAPVRKKSVLPDVVPQKRGRGRPPKNRALDSISTSNNKTKGKTKIVEGPRKIPKKAMVVTVETSSDEEEEEVLPNKRTTASAATSAATKSVMVEPPKGVAGKAQAPVEPSVGQKRSNGNSHDNFSTFRSTALPTATSTTAPRATIIGAATTTTAATNTSTNGNPVRGPLTHDVPSKPKRSRFEDDSFPTIPVVSSQKGFDRAFLPAEDRTNSAAQGVIHQSNAAPVIAANTPRFQPLLSQGADFGSALSSYQQQHCAIPPPTPVARPPSTISAGSIGSNGIGTGGGMGRWETYHSELRADDRRNEQGYAPPPRPPPPPTPPPVQSMPPPAVPLRTPTWSNYTAESRDPRLKHRNGGSKSRFDDAPDPTSSVPPVRVLVPQHRQTDPQASPRHMSHSVSDPCGGVADRDREGRSDNYQSTPRGDSRDVDRRGQFEAPAPVRRDVSATSQGSYSSDSAAVVGAGRGRGRSATLPAWMTAAAAPAGGNSSETNASTGDRWGSNGHGRQENARDRLETSTVPARNIDPRLDQSRYDTSPRYCGRDTGGPAAGASGNAGGGDNVRGAGRGRDATLPAWMTSQQAAASKPPVPPPSTSGSIDGWGRERNDNTRERDRYRNDRVDREPDRSSNRWQPDNRDAQRDAPIANRNAPPSNNVLYPSFQEQVDRLRQQQPAVQGNANPRVPPAVSASITDISYTTSTVKGPCGFCHGRKKLRDCPVVAHVTGMLVTPLFDNANQATSGSAQGRCVDGRGCGTPEHFPDQSVGIDSKVANDEAANALLDMFDSGAQDTNIAASGAPRGSASPVVALPSSASTPLAAATIGKCDDMSVERARYLQSKQQHSAEHGDNSNSNSGQEAKSTADAVAPPVTTTNSNTGAQKHGKWGALVGSPRSLGLVKLGTKENDPKKRLEQTSRNSLGVFAATSLAKAGALGAAQGVQGLQGDRHYPPSRSARPSKSCLRSGSFGSAGDTDTAASEVSAGSSSHNGHTNGTSAGAGARAATRDGHLQWQDMSGKSLSTRHVYENEFDLEPGVEATGV